MAYRHQQLVSSSVVMVDSAGNGGFMDNCFAITVKNVVSSEARYSYTTIKGTCKTSDGTVASPRKVSRDPRTCPLTTSRL